MSSIKKWRKSDDLELAKQRYETFHEGKATRVRVFEYDDGEPGVTAVFMVMGDKMAPARDLPRGVSSPAPGRVATVVVEPREFLAWAPGGAVLGGRA